jgi:hypothetical protein
VHWVVTVCINCASVDLCIVLCRCASVVHQLICALGCDGAHWLCISRVVHWVVSVRIGCVSVDLCIKLCRCASVVHQLICALGCVGAHRYVAKVQQLGCDGARQLCIS